MITKDELRKLLNSSAQYLNSLELTQDEILGILKLMKDFAILSGVYKDQSTKKEL